MNCACHKQIIWFFDEPTIIACPTCEKTFHSTDNKCNECGGDLLNFTATVEEYTLATKEEC